MSARTLEPGDEHRVKFARPSQPPFPYGIWRAADGSEVLFDRDYRPMYQRRVTGPAERAAPDEWIPRDGPRWGSSATQQFVRSGSDDDWRHPEIREAVARLLDEWHLHAEATAIRTAGAKTADELLVIEIDSPLQFVAEDMAEVIRLEAGRPFSCSDGWLFVLRRADGVKQLAPYRIDFRHEGRAGLVQFHANAHCLDELTFAKASRAAPVPVANWQWQGLIRAAHSLIIGFGGIIPGLNDGPPSDHYADPREKPPIPVHLLARDTALLCRALGFISPDQPFPIWMQVRQEFDTARLGDVGDTDDGRARQRLSASARAIDEWAAACNPAWPKGADVPLPQRSA